MGAAWNPPIPIEDMFEQLRAGAAFAAEGGDALSKPAMVCIGYNLILKTGLFDEGCRDCWWRKKSQADRTMATFKKHFKMWEKDRCLMLTTGTAGFHGANHVEPPVPAAPPIPVAPINAELVEIRAALQAIQLAMAAQALAPAAPPPRRPAANTPLAVMGHCWTHGYSGSLPHTSASCVNQVEGHQQNATHADRMAGTDRI
eukprot:scaffold181064_cov60-Attheya_sp.AAC.1